VTVLSTQDPVRLYTNFATLDAVSGGRAQLIVGRGSLTESFPLFGFDLTDYEQLFEEKLDLLMRLLHGQPVTWSGDFRPPLTDQHVSPPIPEGHIPTWVGVGGSPHSVMRAARFGLPLMLAIIAGKPERFAGHVELYRRALERQGKRRLPIGLHSLGFVAATDEEALDMQWPYYKEQFEWAARERGWRPPTYEQFLAEVDHGSMYVGSPATVATRIADVIRTLRLSRFDLLYAVGRVPHEQRMATIELYGREVIPRVRELLADAPADGDTPAVGARS
jgi:alkanesulfonate monooxygenase SsuD/methylene tetrahydromethanopterin reductase-like flavin-dependent oxidoreductase (luciferase family)